MRETSAPAERATGIAVALYAVMTALMLLQQPGYTTYDTRAELTERPGDFLSGAFSLWHPESNFGEFQNQAYGYLFPQGTWFWLSDLLGTPGWVSQRLWSALILVLACEGARRVARAVGLAELPALLAGAFFALSPRLLGTVTVQTAESLPGAVMPWLVLPVVLHQRGRLSGRAAALLSGAAVVCMGGVNAVETAACLPLAVLLVLWGVRNRLVTWRFASGWAAAVGVACLWWALPLAVLAKYAPPFFEYVESASDTTSLIGWSEAARGDSSWLGYLLSGDRPWWPAAFDLATDPVLVVVAAVAAGVGLAGLTLMESPARRPLLLAALLGLGCLTVAHGGVAGAPVASFFRDLLDGPLQIFRNVHKIDPAVRLPLALGFGTAVAAGVERMVARRPRFESWRSGLILVPLLALAVLGQPFLGSDTRTPGWTEISGPWQQARDYLAAQQPRGGSQEADRTLVVPGSSFAQQTWGWTLDEPLAILGGVDMVSRTQVPLVPGESIRYLSALDQSIVTGRVTEALVDELARAGIGHVVLRRDLLRQVTRSPYPGGAAVALAKAGLQRVGAFGSTADGPQVEVFRVPRRLPVARASALDNVVTVRGAAESSLLLQAAGLVGADQPTVLDGEPGWDRPADVITDTDQRRERAFGSNDEGLSSLMAANDSWRVERAAHDFPGDPGSTPVVARYAGLSGLDASSAQGYADNFGPVITASGPYAAIDGAPDTQWVSSVATAPERQWLRLRFAAPRPVRTVTVTPVANDPQIVPIRTIEVVAGAQSIRARVGTTGAPVRVPLDGSSVASVTVRVVEAATAARSARVGLREVAVDGLQPHRSFVIPGAVGTDASLAFSTVASRRACFITPSVPDCDVTRIRQPEEAGGIDRSFDVKASGSYRVRGHVVARNTPEAALLLDQVERRPPVEVTSSYGGDPKVAGRFAYDGQQSTAWVSDDSDLYPTLTFQWRRQRTVTGISVASNGVADAPVAAIITSGRRTQRVALDAGREVAIDPVHTNRLQVRFEKAPGAAHVVVPEIELTGVEVTRPLVGDAPTGALCGLGPAIELGGRELRTRVIGTMADLVNGTPLVLETCDPSTVRLDPGNQVLHAVPTSEFELADISLVPDGPQATPARDREVTVRRWDGDRRTLRVASGPASVLWLPENANAGWVADSDGRRLQPIRVDGWQQAWLLPASQDAATVRLRYAPQQAYDVVLPLGLALSGSVLLLGAVCLVIVLLRRSSRGEWRDWPSVASEVRPLSWGVAVVAAGVLLGPVAGVGLLAGAFLPRNPPRSAAAVLVLVSGSGLLDALGGGHFMTGSADVAAALAVGLVAGLVLGRPTRRTVVA